MSTVDRGEPRLGPECKGRRAIRSYVLRGGRTTVAQQRALIDHGPAYRLRVEDGPACWRSVFGRVAPVVLEIGFGMGDSLAQMAEQEPDKDFVGVEVHAAGVGRLLNNAAQRRLANVRVYLADAVDVLSHCVPDHSLARVQLYFPDPWHKKKHHKRRLVQPAFGALICRKLVPAGILHLATDWEPYAEHMAAVLDAVAGLQNTQAVGAYAPRPAFRPVTKFERRGTSLGHGVWDLVYRRCAAER